MQGLDELVDRGVKAIVVACNTSTAVAIGDFRRRYDLPILGVIRPGAAAAALATRNRRVGVIATPATVRSRAYFAAIKDENPAVEVYEHATPTLVPLVEAGRAERAGRGGSRGRGARAAARPARRGGRVHLPAAAVGADRHAAARLHPLPAAAPAHRGRAGERIAIVDSATATASSLAELLAINALEAPEGGDATHVQLTTGDVDALPDDRRRMFGDAFPTSDDRRGRGSRRRDERPGGRGRAPAKPPWRDDRVWQAGFLVGSALGAAATVLGRRAERRAARRRPGRLGRRRADRDRAPASRAGGADGRGAPGAEPHYRQAMERIVPALSAALETELPGVVERSEVVDRAGWVRANTTSFAALIGRLEDELLDQVMPPAAGSARRRWRSPTAG